jgi:hypothetical protein
VGRKEPELDRGGCCGQGKRKWKWKWIVTEQGRKGKEEICIDIMMLLSWSYYSRDLESGSGWTVGV